MDDHPVTIAERLRGGDPRSLGRVDEVIELVLGDPARFDELFGCLLHDDPVVRMRAGDGLEKITRQRPELLEPYAERLLTDVAAIEQPSVQWHLAQMLREVTLNPSQRRRAVEVLKHNVELSGDWIVINLTLEALDGEARGARRQAAQPASATLHDRDGCSPPRRLGARRGRLRGLTARAWCSESQAAGAVSA